VLLLPIAIARTELRASLRPWLPLLVYTVLEIGVPWLLLSDAERRVDSSLSGLVIAGVPLVAAVLARLGNGGDRLNAQRVAGLFAGIAGVGLLLGFHGGTAGARPILELLGVVVCYASGPLIIERWLSSVSRRWPCRSCPTWPGTSRRRRRSRPSRSRWCAPRWRSCCSSR